MENKPILNIMVDLETTAKTENAGILSWAMVAFAVNGEDIPEFTFERVVTLRSCFFAGMRIEVDTQEWWDKQEPQAKHHILTREAESIRTVAKDAYMQLEALAESHDIYLWSRGIDFDLPKIKWCFEHLLEKDEKNFPFKFSHKMDVRTVLKFMGIDQSQFEFQGVQHRSVDDCKHDIRMIQEAYKWKEKWMMAYTAVEAGKTAKELKEKRLKESPKEQTNSTVIGDFTPNTKGEYLPEISMATDSEIYVNDGEPLMCTATLLRKLERKLAISVAMVDVLTDENDRLKESLAELRQEKEALKQEIKNLQAMG